MQKLPIFSIIIIKQINNQFWTNEEKKNTENISYILYFIRQTDINISFTNTSIL